MKPTEALIQPDTDKIDEAVLGLLYLTLHDGCRAWKGFDYDALDRLYRKGIIENPVAKTKSVVFTAEGLQRAEEAFEKLFVKPTKTHNREASGPAKPSWENLPGHKDTKICQAGGTTGFICRSAVDGKSFFRVYESDGTFVDYKLSHDDLEVTITQETLATFYQRHGENTLDHAPEVLGIIDRKE